MFRHVSDVKTRSVCGYGGLIPPIRRSPVAVSRDCKRAFP